jgi:IS4 transposase
VKLHLTLDHAGYLPEAMVITTGKYSELTVARGRRYARGTILVMDRGFVDFRWFNQLHESGVFFVTRIKKDTPYRVVQSDPIVTGKNLVSDERIELTGRRTRKRYPEQLRLVSIDTDEGERLQFLTNHMTLAASTIADIYKDRWQIEIFFKLLKQNLRIKSFVGTSANAVWTQIWTALIAMLLIKFLQLKATFGWSYSNLVYFLRMNLFVYRDLWEWLNNPFIAPPDPDLPTQMDFRTALIGTAE